MAQTFRCLPSDLLHIEDPYDAFRLDRAVWLFGTTLKAELESQKGKNEKEIERKQDRVLKKWIPELAASPTKYRDPGKRANEGGNQL